MVGAHVRWWWIELSGTLDAGLSFQLILRYRSRHFTLPALTLDIYVD